MATTTTTIKVTADTRDAQRALGDLQTSLGRLATVGAMAALTKQFADFADEITNLNNRLRTISDTNTEVAARFTEVLNIANATRMPLAAVGELYYGLAAAARDAGATQADVTMITDRVAKSLAASGTSATQAAGSLLQLRQAFQSGRFQGDELRSILEGMPAVAKAMADQFGVTVGALRYLGSQGRITSADFVNAMRTAGASIDQAFGRTIPTVSQSLTVLRNNFTNLVGEFDRQTGTSSALSGAILKIADSLDSMSKSIDFVINILKLLGAAAVFVFLNTFAGRIGSAIISVAGAIRNLGLMFASAGQQASSVGRIFSALGLNLGKFIEYTKKTWQSWSTMVQGMGKASGPITGIFDQIFRAVFLTLDRVVRTIGYAFKNMYGAIAVMAAGIMGLLDPIIEKTKNAVDATARFFKLREPFKKAAPVISDEDLARYKEMNDHEIRRILNLQRAREEMERLNEQQVKNNELIRKANSDREIEFNKLVRDQQANLDLAKLEGAERTVQQAINQANSQLIKEIRDDLGNIIHTTEGLSDLEKSRLRNLVLQTNQIGLQTEISRDLLNAQEDMAMYQRLGSNASQAQLAIEQKVAQFRRENLGLTTKEMEAQVRAAETIRQRLQMIQTVNTEQRAAQDLLELYTKTSGTMGTAQFQIESKILDARRQYGDLLTNEIEGQIRATEEARQRLSMMQEINTANRAATENLSLYSSNLLSMSSSQLDVEMKVLDAKRQYGDLLTKELEDKIRSTAESERQLGYLRQMKQGAEELNRVLRGPEAGAMAAGQLSNLLPIDAALTAQQSLMNGLQELRNRDLISEQQYQDAKLAAHVQSMEAMYQATKKKFENEEILRIQGIVGDKFGYEAIKGMASESAAFQKKTDMEKYQFGIEQASNMFTELGKENERAFRLAKAFNIANAIMNTYMGATKALATYPWPFGLIAAAAAVAAGMAQVSAIRAQTYSGRALGGPVMGNESYIVGERGPEIFTPATSGRITRNNDIGQSQPVTVNFNISTVDAAGFDTLLVQRRGLITSMISDAQQERGRRL